jgi:hypothetical protein
MDVSRKVEKMGYIGSQLKGDFNIDGIYVIKRRTFIMSRMKLVFVLAIATAFSRPFILPSVAQNEGQNMAPNPPLDPSIKTTFVHLGNGEPGVLYEPVSPGPKAQIALFVMHATNDFLTHSACTELSKRGYRVFCVNNSIDKAGSSTMADEGNMDRILLQAKAAIVYLRKDPNVKKIVLWGHSGGASVMTSYQNIAENGVKICQDDVKIYKCPNSLAGLPPADGVILGDANWGRATTVLINLDPSVSNDNKKVNPELDMFMPQNGFNSAGSHYSQEFIRKFQTAQAKRENELIDLAQSRLAAIKAGKGQYSDNEPFIIAGASSGANKLHATDMSLFEHTQKAWPLLHANGSATTEVVHSVRVPTLAEDPSKSMMGGSLRTTVTSFLMSYAVRVTADYGYGGDTSMRGVVWNSNWTDNPGNVEGIAVPFLTMGNTGSFESSCAETIHNHVKSTDKTLVYVEGATHGYPTCKKCEKTPGQFGDTIKTLYDYADSWLSKSGRFMN